MEGILYLEKLFENILGKSKTIKGRIQYAPRYGSELDTDNLQDLVDSLKLKEYPLALIMPPRIKGDSVTNFVKQVTSGNLVGEEAERRVYDIAILFVQKSFTNNSTGPGLVPVNIDRNRSDRTGRSKHRIVEDWYDMDRVARDFVRMLAGWIEHKELTGYLEVIQDTEFITPVTTMGQDKSSGVYLKFDIALTEGCDVDDYEEGALEEIEEPNINHQDA